MSVILRVKQSECAKALGVKFPGYSRERDAGIDLRSAEDVEITPGQKRVVGTGIHVAIPEGFVGFIKDRSGLAVKCGIHTLAGVVDANYRGEVKVVLLNTGTESFQVRVNDRIAQMVLLPVPEVKIEAVEELDDTNRGACGWGSTGVK